MLDEIENRSFLELFYEELKSASKNKREDFWDELSEDHKKELEASWEESEDPTKLVSHDEVMKKSRQWLKK